MAWLYLFAAALLEIVWALGLKSTHGFTRLGPSAGVIVVMAASLFLLSLAARGIPIGTAYAIWTGIGGAGTAVCGMLFLGEPTTVARIVCIVLIVSGVVGLKLFSR